jgi:starch phosphorylase
MVHHYYLEGYHPGIERRARLEEDRCRRGRALAGWKQRVRASWDRVRVTHVEVDLPGEATIGKAFEVKAWVDTAGLTAADLAVQVCIGRLRENRDIGDPEIIPMAQWGAPTATGQVVYETTVACRTSGVHGVTVRVLPHHEDMGHPHETGLITWAS